MRKYGEAIRKKIIFECVPGGHTQFVRIIDLMSFEKLMNWKRLGLFLFSEIIFKLIVPNIERDL